MAKSDGKSIQKGKGVSRKYGFITQYVVVNICRFILAATFLFSAFTKANDPVGLSIKLSDYAGALGIHDIPGYLLFLAGITLTLVETVLGICLMVGTRHRKWVAWAALLFMAVMTLVTVWVAVANPVSDCGCFGDALVLTNTQTLLKNIVLLAMALAVTLCYRMIFRLIHKNWSWLITVPVVVAMVLFFSYCAYMLPVVDYLPFAEGTDLRTAVNTGDGLNLNYKVTFIYTNGTDTLELSDQDEDPDSTIWTYVETRNELLSDNPEAAIDFYVLDADGDDVTLDIIESGGLAFLITVPEIEKASEASSGKFNTLYDYCNRFGYDFYFVTGTADEETKEAWRHNTGAQYPFYESENRMLWQVVRDNPGVVLLDNGVVVRKWSQANMPDFNLNEELQPEKIEELPHVRRIAARPMRF